MKAFLAHPRSRPSVGFIFNRYRVRHCVPSEKNKDYKPDWTSWANVDRTKVQDQGLGSEKNVKPFDPVIVGPWMDLWNITTHVNGGKNVHVDRYMASESGKLPAGEGYLPDNW